MTRPIAPLALLLAVVACTEGDLVHTLQIEVPSSVASIENGTLRVALYRYDPHLADAAAARVDRTVITFNHQTGRRTLVLAQVGAREVRGERFYLAVHGCSSPADGEQAILWDGLSVELPSRVVMRARPDPLPCAAVDSE